MDCTVVHRLPNIVSDDAVDRVSINEQTLSARLRVGAWEDEKSMAQELGLALRHFQQYNTTLQRQWLGSSEHAKPVPQMTAWGWSMAQKKNYWNKSKAKKWKKMQFLAGLRDI